MTVKAKKTVVWANTSGKPLATIRKIDAEGKGYKMKAPASTPRPAKLSNMQKKRNIAMAMAKRNAKRDEQQVVKIKNTLKTVTEIEKNIKKKLNQAFVTPANKVALKQKLDKTTNMKKLLTKKLNEATVNFNLSRDKLRAQRRAG
jgi:hypothetical protein